ncbi:MAG: hypothetical protein V7727_18365, partial [Sneathiella sp.]
MGIAELVSRSGNWTGLNHFAGIDAPLDANGNALQIKLSDAHYAVAGVNQMDNNLSKIHDINAFRAEEILRSKFELYGLVPNATAVKLPDQNGIEVYEYQFELEGRVISFEPFREQIADANLSVEVQTELLQAYIDYANQNIKANYQYAIGSTENGAPLSSDIFDSVMAKAQLKIAANVFLSENEDFKSAITTAVNASSNPNLDQSSLDNLDDNAIFASDKSYVTADGNVIIAASALDGSEHIEVITKDMYLRLSDKEMQYLYSDIVSKVHNGDPYSVAELLEARGVDLNQFAYSRTAEENGGNIFDLEIVFPGETVSDGFSFITDGHGNDVAGQSYSSYSDEFVLADNFNFGQLEVFDPEAALQVLVERAVFAEEGLSDFLVDGASLEISLSALNATKGFESTQAEFRQAIRDGDVTVDDIGKLSKKTREIYDVGVVDGQVVYEHSAVTLGGEIGSGIGGFLASYFAGDKIAVQIAASAVTRSLGAEIGKTLGGGNYQFSSETFFKSTGASIGSGIGSFLATSLFNEIVELDGVAGDLANIAVGVIGAAYGQAAATSIISGTSFAAPSIANIGAGIVTAVYAYAGQALAQAIFDGNPEGANIGGMIGGIIGAYFGPIGAFIGAFIGSAIGGLFGGDPAEPEAVSVVELGFRLDAQGFFVVDGYAKDGGDAAVARNIGQAGADALNAFLSVIGGRALDYNKKIGFGYVGSEYIGSGGRRFGSVQALLDAEVTNVFKEIQIEGGDLYMKRALVNTAATNIDDLSDDLEIAVRYGQYMDNQVLFLEDLTDWEQD